MEAVLQARCLVCHTPLTGALGALGRVAGIRRASQNPNLCSRCDAHIADGSMVELAVFFADLTGFTQLTAELGAIRTHELVDVFLREAKEIVVRWDGFVLQFAGDEIMALFNAPLQRDDYRRRAVAAAAELQRRMPEISERVGRELQTTVGIASGFARVGRLGSDDIKDYTAVGDVVNRSARLVSRVEPGGILVDADVYEGVRDDFPDAPRERVTLKGFDEPVEVASLGGGEVLRGAVPEATSERRPMRAVALASAVFGAPCAGLMVLNPLLVSAGIGAAGFGAVAAFLDQSFIRVPLLALAVVAALANLFFALRRRAGDADEGVLPAPGSRGAIAVSVLALSVVAFEMVAHAMMH